ncbi:MAG: hypothetical protein PHG05_04090 [Candidatus Nanoarchaeia archaeon]|nr:hypothetical protein [Candidatus Nanoarchaeia archaeon]
MKKVNTNKKGIKECKVVEEGHLISFVFACDIIDDKNIQRRVEKRGVAFRETGEKRFRIKHYLSYPESEWQSCLCECTKNITTKKEVLAEIKRIGKNFLKDPITEFEAYFAISHSIPIINF